MTDLVRLSVDSGVLRLTLNRPDKKNALNNEMYAALAAAMVDAEADDSIRVLLFDAEGADFTAGNDIVDFAALAAGALAPDQMSLQAFLPALARARKPYVAGVTGLAIGIGVTMLLHCDLVYVADDAKLMTPFINLAAVPEAASTLLMPARIGHARAYAMFALCEPVDGRTAAQIGLANAALPAAEVRPKALAAARALATRPPGALKATKQLMRDAAQIESVMKREIEIFMARLQGAGGREALRAFAERRPPDFSKIDD